MRNSSVITSAQKHNSRKNHGKFKREIDKIHKNKEEKLAALKRGN